MQARSTWSPPGGALGRLVERAHARARDLSVRRAELRALATEQELTPEFAAALRGVNVSVIGEVKRRSPSKGAINVSLDTATHVAAYERGGAAALSIVTEPTEFGGSPEDVTAARRASRLPVLRKDFLVHPLQIVEARSLGASAVLLIARAVPSDLLRILADEALAERLTPLVEVRDEYELDDALAIEHAIIGVNNRDLETLEIDASISERLIPRIPSSRIAVWESGVAARDDVERAARVGADAVLVGSSLSSAADPARTLRGLTEVARGPRAG